MQWHPEVMHSTFGQQVLENFLYRGAGLAGRLDRGERHRRSWSPRSASRSATARVICGLSGGVDSAVAAALVQKAVGDQLTCVFVDHGLLRKGEAEQVEKDFVAATGVDLVVVDAAEHFLSALAGVSDPETKRKIIGREFIRVFEQAAREVVGALRRRRTTRSSSSSRARSTPTSSSPAAAPAPPTSSRTTTWAACPTTCSSSSSSRCAPLFKDEVRAGRPRARPARGDRLAPAVPGAGPRHPDRR